MDRFKGLHDESGAAVEDSAGDDGAGGGGAATGRVAGRKRPRGGAAASSSEDGGAAAEGHGHGHGHGAHGDMDPAMAALEREHEEITKVRRSLRAAASGCGSWRRRSGMRPWWPAWRGLCG